MRDLSGLVVEDCVLVARVGPARTVQRYRAADRLLGRSMGARILSDAPARRPGAIDRFLVRARFGAVVFPRWRTLHALPIFRTGRAHETAYTITPPVEDDDLVTFVERRGPLPWPLTRRLLVHACSALHVAHGAGVAHGDLRPEHCLVRERIDDDLGHARHDLLVADFGTPLGEQAILVEPGPPKLASVHDDLRALGRLALFMLLGEPPTDDHVRSVLSEESGPDGYRKDAAAGPDLPPHALAALRRLLTDDLAAAFPDARAVALALAVAEPREADLERLLAHMVTAVPAHIRPVEDRERAFAVVLVLVVIYLFVRVLL